jgi:hypothetical protein
MSEVDRLKDANASFAERFDKGDLETRRRGRSWS